MAILRFSGFKVALAGFLAYLTPLTIAEGTTPKPSSSSAQTSAISVLLPGVSNIHFPLSAETLAAVPGLSLQPPSFWPVGTTTSSAQRGRIHAAVSGSDYAGCGSNADAPPQEIIDLAASLKNNWQLIYAYVSNNIDLEPTAESTKGPLGTYLDQSGNSFDQSSLLVSMLRAAGYQANFVVGSTTLTAAQMGLASLPQQLIIDAGGSTNGTTPYAWVQVYVNNAWETLDPAAKSYSIVTGTNLSQWLSTTPANPPTYNLMVGLLNAMGTADNGYLSNDYNSMLSLIGGRTIDYNYTPPVNTRSGGTVYTYLPTSYRTGLAFNSSSGGPSAVYICTDQVYGHILSVQGNSTLIDGLTIQSGFVDPIGLEIWHPNPGGATTGHPNPGIAAWGQNVPETLTNMGSVISMSFGQVGRFRAEHDGNILNAMSSVGPSAGTNAALLAAGSSDLDQTAQISNLLNQLSGTYTINHHTVAIVRTNNTIDTPMTSTSVLQINSAPASGLQVSASAVPYALSAAQSAQEAIALSQAGATQPVSAASLLGAASNNGNIQFVPSTGASVSNTYSSAQLAVLQSYVNGGYDLVIPKTGPGASAPLGFLAMNNAGTSAFVLYANGTVYKGAADLTPTSPLGGSGTGGSAAEAGPALSGLHIDAASGEVAFAEPLISVGSTSPYKLEFDLLYSSRPDAQVTANSQSPTGRPDAPGFAHNFEMRATASSDGFPMVGSNMAGPGTPGVSAAWNLLINANVIATYYASGGSTPENSGYADAVIGNWLLAAGTNNVATVTRGLTSTVFYRRPWAGWVPATPSGDQLTQSSGAFTLRTATGDNLVFNASDGQIASVTTPTGVQTSFSYVSAPVGSAGGSTNLLHSVSVGSHTFTFGYGNELSTSKTYVLQSVTDETSRQAQLHYGNCYNSISPATAVPQLCAGTKPDWTSSDAWPLTFNFGKFSAGSGGQAILLAGVDVINPTQNGMSNSVIAYDASRMMPTSFTNANSHKTSYFVAPGRSETDDAMGNANYQVTYPGPTTGEWIYTDSFDALGNETEYRINRVGQRMVTTLPSGIDIDNTYDPYGNVTSVSIFQPGQTALVTSTTWNQTWDKPATVTDPLGNVTTYNYNSSNGTLTSVVHPAVTYQGNSVHPTESYTYYSNGQVQTAQAADGEITSYAYAPTTFNLSSITVDSGSAPHLNLKTSLGYDSVGNVNSVTNARGYTTTMTYDAARRPLTTVTPAISGDGGKSHTTTYTYNENGQLTQTSQDANLASPPAQLVSTRGYDPVGNLVTETTPTTGSGTLTTTYSYDADERLSATVDPANQTTSKTYDADSRLYQVLMNGNVTETHSYTVDSKPYQLTDGAGHVTTYGYDIYDRLTKTTYSDGTYEQATLDADGHATSNLNRGGLSTSFIYDAMDRVTSETVQSFSAPFTNTYDEVGRLLTATYSAGTFTYAYDTAGRQAQTTRPDGKIIKYGYDQNGNASGITYPDGYLYSYTFDELDRMLLVSETAPGAQTSTNLAYYSYDPLSRRTQVNYGNSTQTAYTYDAFSGLTALTHTFASTSSMPSITYGYTRDNDERRSGDSVTSAGHLWHPASAGTTTYQPNALNQYTTINGQSLAYDTNGNLKTDPTAPLGSATYGFDQLNRMTSASNTQHSAGYTYDQFSRRASKVVDGTTTTFVDDGNRTIADYNGAGTEIQHYVYGADSTPIVQEYFGGNAQATNVLYVYADGLGSVVFLANTSGNATAAFTYSPWGETASSTSSAYRYAGMRLDSETMLYYDRARYYSPQQGRFVSPDPIGSKGGINIYAYSGNDPLNHVDLSGNDITVDSDGAGGPSNVCFIGSSVLFFGGDFSGGSGASRRANAGGSDLSPTIPTVSVPAYDPGSSGSTGTPAQDASPAPPSGAEGQPVSASGGYAGGESLGDDAEHPYQPGVSSTTGPDNLNNPSTDIEVTAPRPMPAINYSTDPMTQDLIGFAILGTSLAGGWEEELGIGIGKFAGESIAARSAARDFTAAERAQINEIGVCHTCGATSAGTRSGNFVLDHQPPTSLNFQGATQRLYPQCLACSRNQGLAIARLIR